jgi:hypothetical protein
LAGNVTSLALEIKQYSKILRNTYSSNRITLINEWLNVIIGSHFVPPQQLFATGGNNIVEVFENLTTSFWISLISWYTSCHMYKSVLIQGWMHALIGSHFGPLEGKFLLIALVIVSITLNAIVRQMSLNVR